MTEKRKSEKPRAGGMEDEMDVQHMKYCIAKVRMHLEKNWTLTTGMDSSVQVYVEAIEDALQGAAEEEKREEEERDTWLHTETSRLSL